MEVPPPLPPAELAIPIESAVTEHKKDNSNAPTSPAKFKLHLALVVAQALFAGFEVLSRVALDQGVGKTAFTFYRNCLASILLGIYGVLVERKRWTRLTVKNLCYFFFLGFLGVTMNQICYLVGLSLTSVMFASAIRNSIPIMTFMLACLFKLEKVNVRKKHGMAKVGGALIGLAGSLVLSLYKGPVVIGSKFLVFHVNAHQPASSSSLSNHVEMHKLYFFTKHVHFSMVSWHLGAVFLVLSGFSFALFLILQTPVLKTYPAPVTFASISCISSVIQLPVLAAAFEPHWALWRNITLGEALSIVYSGAIGSGIVSGVQSWAVHGGGPVIVAAYQPLETLITAGLSYFFLEESFHLGTLLGGVTIVAGLYLLIWGQKMESRELKATTGGRSLDTTITTTLENEKPCLTGLFSSLRMSSAERVSDESKWTNV